MSGRQGVGEAAATMRLRDRKSGAGVLGDITNKKEVSKSSQSGASKARSKVRNIVVGSCFDFKDTRAHISSLWGIVGSLWLNAL